MPTVIATPGAADANSYVTRAEAEAYFATRPAAQVSAWLTASDDDKDAAVIMATEMFDAAMWWTGSPVDSVQVLAHPRTGLVNRNGVSVPTNIIAPELKRATSEFAGQLLASKRTADNDVARQGITDIGVGSIKLSFAEDTTSQYVGSGQVGVPKVVPDIVLLMIPASWYIVPTDAPTVMIESM